MIFLNGNVDVVTRILEFVGETSEELNTCAMVSQNFRLARENRICCHRHYCRDYGRIYIIRP
jgi:hypothetical protein